MYIYIYMIYICIHIHACMHIYIYIYICMEFSRVSLVSSSPRCVGRKLQISQGLGPFFHIELLKTGRTLGIQMYSTRITVAVALLGYTLPCGQTLSPSPVFLGAAALSLLIYHLHSPTMIVG